MGKADKALKAFIDGIPDGKLTGLAHNAGTIYKDDDFRLDMQGMTSGQPQQFNLQVQINHGVTISTLKKMAPKTVATYLANQSDTAQQVRSGLEAGINI